MNDYIWLAYGLMLLLIAVIFLFTKRQHQKYREACDPFGIAFVEAANHALAGQPSCKLVTETTPNGYLRALQPEQQPAAMQEILRYGADDYARSRHETMRAALQQLDLLTVSNSRQHKFYFGVLAEIYRVNVIFFNACVDLSTLNEEVDFEEFGLFIDNQAFIRTNIAKRLSTKGLAQMKAVSRSDSQ